MFAKTINIADPKSSEQDILSMLKKCPDSEFRGIMSNIGFSEEMAAIPSSARIAKKLGKALIHACRQELAEAKAILCQFGTLSSASANTTNKRGAPDTIGSSPTQPRKKGRGAEK